MNLNDEGCDSTATNTETNNEQLPTEGSITDRAEQGDGSTTNAPTNHNEAVDEGVTLEADKHEVFRTEEAETKDLPSDLNNPAGDVNARSPIQDRTTDPPHEEAEFSDQKQDYDQTETDSNSDSPGRDFNSSLPNAATMQPTQESTPCLPNKQDSDFDLRDKQLAEQTTAELTKADPCNPQLEIGQNSEAVPPSTLDSLADVVELSQHSDEQSQTVDNTHTDKDDSQTRLPQENIQDIGTEDVDSNALKNETQLSEQLPDKDGVTKGVNVLKDFTSPYEQTLTQDHNTTEHAPSHPVQQNSDVAYSVSKQFVDIPTARDGDEGDSLPNGTSHTRGDFGDDSMLKIKSSLPVDARGDSNDRRRLDPRLTRSMPASIGRSNIPNGYHSDKSTRWGRHIPRIPSASPSVKADMREGEARRAMNSAKVPPSVMKMSTVMVSARKRAVLNRNASVFYEERTHSKIISLDEAINSRPPMPFDLEGPGPWSYSPRNKPLAEDNSPEYTFGNRLHEKSGGGRTAYAKTWFNSNSAYTQKVNYDKRWPSPTHYSSPIPLLGRRKPTMLDYPAFSMGIKLNFTINKRGSENEPAPNEYNCSKSDPAIHRKAPSYSISHRHRGTTLWSGSETTPGPGTYNPHWRYSSGNTHHPSFTIRGMRRFKRHELGPHSTL